jgi:hypothetical protein
MIREKKFEVLMALSMKGTVFWDVTPCRLMEVYYRLNGSTALIFGVKNL